MALTLKDRVLETTTTTGTGSISLGGTQTGYQAFSVIGDGNTTYYTIQGVDSNGNPTGEWEVGLGTYTAAGNTLSRDTVYDSSNGGAKVVFSAGTKQVFCDLPAEQVSSGGGANYPVNTNITSMTGLTGGLDTPDYLALDTAAAASIALGKLRWNAATATASFGIIDGTTEVNIGEQMYAYVTNAESVTITAGQAVYLYQATGNRASVKLANNTGDATSAKTLGLVTADIAAGATGFVTTQGTLGKLDTSAFTEGTTLYLGATAGSLTSTKPKAPNHLVYIGVVERSNAGNGQIYVKPQNGYELDEIHDVQITSPANGQTIIYDATNSLWKNANLTAGTGVSITNGAASITVTNSAPDQTVVMNNGTGISVTGTYPNFTITNTSPDVTTVLTPVAPITVTGTYPNFTLGITQAGTASNGYLSSTDWNTFNNKQPAGTYVTSVTGSGVISSSGGTTPAISISQATTSTSGYLSSTDWNTFNNKQAALVSGTNIKTVNGTTLLGSGDVSVGVTSVTGTAPIVSSGGATPAISIPAATSLVNGYLTSTDWTTFNGKYSVGGALGTPASGTLTNCTGLPVGGISATGTPSATTYLRGDGTWSTVSGSGSPGGANTQVQYNSSGTFAGSANFTFDGTTVTSAASPGNTTPALALTGTPNNAAGGRVGVLAVGSNFTAADKNIMASFVQNINDYTQIIVQNPNAGASASADFVVNNDNTTGSGTYGDFGINSSTFSGTGALGAANTTYLYSNGGDLALGTNTANSIHLVTNASATDAVTINSNNAIAFNGSYGTAGYVLSTNGSGSAPTWIAAGSAGGVALGLVSATAMGYNLQ